MNIKKTRKSGVENMKKIDYRILLIYILILFHLIFTNIFGYKYFGNITNIILIPLFWIILFMFSFYFFKEDKQRIHSKTIKEQSVFIIILIYLIIYFIQGLFFGYTKNPYDRSFYGIILNIWSYISIIFYQEYVRNILSKNSWKILTVILFVLIDINLYSFLNINDSITLFKQISSILIPSIATNILLVYLTINCGFVSCLLYRIPISLTTYILPIFPDLNWLFISVEQIILPFIVYLEIRNIDTNKVQQRKNKISIFLIGILLLFILFTTGLFKYKPISVMSNSMLPLIKKGDIVILEEKSIEELNNLKKYDIICYRLGNTIVIHRIVAIEKQNYDILYTTKGDNNKISDKEKVKPEQIIGIYKFKIPYIGYPSVWLNEFFNKNQNLVETGK